MSNGIVTKASQSVSAAIESRRSVRGFKPDAVDPALVKEIIRVSSRAASGGNLQPWKLYVLAGAERDAFVAQIAEKMKTTPFGEGPEYDIYPHDLTEPYKTRRGRVAAMMYELVGIDRGDAAARAAQMGANFSFFGAPVGMFLTIDRQMGPPQFADLGLFLGNMMLLAREHGLHTCPQEAWSLWGKSIRAFCGVPDEDLVFCGLALGYADEDAPINALRSERAPIEDFVVFKGL